MWLNIITFIIIAFVTPVIILLLLAFIGIIIKKIGTIIKKIGTIIKKIGTIIGKKETKQIIKLKNIYPNAFEKYCKDNRIPLVSLNIC